MLPLGIWCFVDIFNAKGRQFKYLFHLLINCCNNKTRLSCKCPGIGILIIMLSPLPSNIRLSQCGINIFDSLITETLTVIVLEKNLWESKHYTMLFKLLVVCS